MIAIKEAGKKMELLEEKAELLKAISHPVRLCVISGLLDEPGCNVNKITECLKIPQSTVSQHLARLKSAGIVVGKRNGVQVNYRVVNEDVIRVVKCLIADS